VRRRQFGAVRRLPSGRWQARYTLPSGERISPPDTFATKAEAGRYLARVELEVASGTHVDHRAGEVTVGEWAGRWMAAATHLRPKTRASYESLVRTVIGPALGGRRLRDLRPMQVREWVAASTRRGLSPSRVRQAYRLLSQMLDTAVLDGLIPSSPCVGIRLPRLAEHEPTILTMHQVADLAAVMPEPSDGLFVMTLAYTGMRFGEGAALARRNVDLERRVLTVAASLSDANGLLTIEEPKSHQHRIVTLPAFLADELAGHLAARVKVRPDALVFTSPDGLALRHSNFMRRVWHPACERVGVAATPHDLRASHATWLSDMGWSPVEIAARLGHAKATVTTKHYARRVSGRDVDIAAGLDEAQDRVRARKGTWRARADETAVVRAPVDAGKPR
jgi:integrase